MAFFLPFRRMPNRLRTFRSARLHLNFYEVDNRTAPLLSQCKRQTKVHSTFHPLYKEYTLQPLKPKGNIGEYALSVAESYWVNTNYTALYTYVYCNCFGSVHNSSLKKDKVSRKREGRGLKLRSLVIVSVAFFQ